MGPMPPVSSDKKKAEEKAAAKDKKTGLTPSQDAANTNPPPTSSASGKTLLNLPPNTPIKTGKNTTTTASEIEGNAELFFANKTPAERAALLLRLGQIPNLYPTGQAPNSQYVGAMGNRIVWRPADATALKNILLIQDQLGDATPDATLTNLISNPGLSSRFFGKVSAAPKAVTSLSALEAEMNAKFQDLFETPADKSMVKAYAKEVNRLEAGAGITAQQKEDIFLKYTQKKANDLYSLSQTGMAPGVTEKGALGSYVRNIRAAYADNGIPMNEKDIYTKAVSSLRSKDAYNNTISGIQMQAATIMPAFKDLINQGKTAKEILSPYINLRAQILEIPADQIKVSDMYDVGSSDKPVSIQDYKNKLYGSDAFRKTNAFKERSLGDMQALLKAFNIG
jgi:hypothetical protein